MHNRKVEFMKRSAIIVSAALATLAPMLAAPLDARVPSQQKVQATQDRLRAGNEKAARREQRKQGAATIAGKPARQPKSGGIDMRVKPGDDANPPAAPAGVEDNQPPR